MLVPLLEGNTLSVPGHGDVIKAAPGFRLFATQRFVAILKSVFVKLSVVFEDFFSLFMLSGLFCYEILSYFLQFVCLLKYSTIFLNFSCKKPDIFAISGVGNARL